MSLSNTAANLLVRCSAIASQLALVPIAMTAIGKDLYGVWMAATSIGLIATAFDLGTLNATFNLAARSRYRRAAELCTVAATQRSAVAALAVFGVIALGACSLDMAALLNTPQPPMVVRDLVLLVCFLSLLTLPFSVFNQMRLARLEAARIAPWLVAGNVLGFLTAWLAARAAAVPFVFIAASLLPAVAAQAGAALCGLTRARLPLRSLVARLPRAHWRIRREGSPFFVVQLATLCSFHLGNLIVAGMLSSAQAAEYSLANRYFSIITIILSVLMATAWPIYARLLAAGETARLRRVYRRNLLLSVGFAAACTSVLLAASGPFFRHWTRAAVQPGTGLMLALGAFAVVNAALGNVSALLSAARQLRIVAVVTISMLVPNVVLSVLLVRQLGSAGTAAAAASCCAVMLAVYLWHWKRLGGSTRHD